MSAPWHSRRVAAGCTLALINALPPAIGMNTRMLSEAKRIIRRISTTPDKRKLPTCVVDRASCLAQDLAFCDEMCALVAKNFFLRQHPDHYLLTFSSTEE